MELQKKKSQIWGVWEIHWAPQLEPCHIGEILRTEKNLHLTAKATNRCTANKKTRLESYNQKSEWGNKGVVVLAYKVWWQNWHRSRVTVSILSVLILFSEHLQSEVTSIYLSPSFGKHLWLGNCPFLPFVDIWIVMWLATLNSRDEARINTINTNFMWCNYFIFMHAS